MPLTDHRREYMREYKRRPEQRALELQRQRTPEARAKQRQRALERYHNDAEWRARRASIARASQIRRKMLTPQQRYYERNREAILAQQKEYRRQRWLQNR